MSDTITIKAEVRTKTGTKGAVRLREEGKMPAVVYGHKQESISITLDAKTFNEELHQGHRIFNVEMGDNQETLLVKDVQYDHLGRDIIHVDLMRVNLNERVKVDVPIEVRGTAIGTQQGGILDEIISEISIECAVNQIPETLMIQVKDLEIGNSIHAKDIELPNGATLLIDPEATVLICHAAKLSEEGGEAEAGEAPSAPEVITERSQEE